MPWKRRMLAVLRDLGLETYVEKDAAPPAPANSATPTNEELKAIKKWQEQDTKTRTWIELAITDSEMVHILGMNTASQMWKQLTLVKESHRKLGILAT